MLLFFFFNDPAPPEISTLPLPAALPISANDPGAGPDVDGPQRAHGREQCHEPRVRQHENRRLIGGAEGVAHRDRAGSEGDVRDRKSTRLNSSHLVISYAVFCLKKNTILTDRPPGTSPQVQTSHPEFVGPTPPNADSDIDATPTVTCAPLTAAEPCSSGEYPAAS